jgi:PBP1b-binding outer membrane lipoprotein LpoB
MRKKIFAALLTAVLVAGCSSENDEPEARQTPSPTPDTTETVATDTTDTPQVAPAPTFAAKYCVAGLTAPAPFSKIQWHI